MRDTIVRLTDDMDGSLATRSVVLSFDGKRRTLDLSDENYAKLAECVEPWLMANHNGSLERGRGRKAVASTAVIVQPTAKAPAKRARKTAAAPRKRAANKAVAAPVDTADVRKWAKGKKITVSEKGRIPAAVLAEYQAAH